MGIDLDKVKALREKRGLTQDEAAKLAGLPNRQKWYQLESGRIANPTIATLEAIAKALGVKARDLLK
ncbi:helix-turn-helix transcriptional regulator [Humisphaera borealis]|uniref:Helix-turn-helix transcriptional regulator n=1 Tax=Humisphaera borealis TaxID=2807512 RepID=A0A7M2X024_9BACT|nr:helix-turn-helix transcriptional regulator [Humisphaera borealis]QOV91075.1 helix-turn-helix transcriptional regulator [Humisphaera borealis]